MSIGARSVTDDFKRRRNLARRQTNDSRNVEVNVWEQHAHTLETCRGFKKLAAHSVALQANENQSLICL